MATTAITRASRAREGRTERPRLGCEAICWSIGLVRGSTIRFDQTASRQAWRGTLLRRSAASGIRLCDRRRAAQLGKTFDRRFGNRIRTLRKIHEAQIQISSTPPPADSNDRSSLALTAKRLDNNSPHSSPANGSAPTRSRPSGSGPEAARAETTSFGRLSEIVRMSPFKAAVR